MQVKSSLDQIEVNVQTRRDGNTSVFACRDDNTEVFFGPLHASVTLIDLGVRVIMDPDPGDWENVVWARQTALRVLSTDITAWLPQLLNVYVNKGVAAGRSQLQDQLKSLLFSSSDMAIRMGVSTIPW